MASANTGAWQYDREVVWHTLAIEGEAAFVLVYKSGAGDYVVTAMREGDAAGGEIEYHATLAKAKAFGESLAAGLWKDYTVDDGAAEVQA